MIVADRAGPNPSLRLCLWCLAAVAVEVALYFSYRGHDARFHWFTHLFVGTSTALVVMTAMTLRTRRAVSYPLVWPVLGHLFAMTPDLAFTGGVAHQRWMDVFLGHVSTHFVPGRNVTWYAVFLASLALYLASVDRSGLSPFVRHHLNVHGKYSFLLPDLAGGPRTLGDPDSPDPEAD